METPSTPTPTTTTSVSDVTSSATKLEPDTSATSPTETSSPTSPLSSNDSSAVASPVATPVPAAGAPDSSSSPPDSSSPSSSAAPDALVAITDRDFFFDDSFFKDSWHDFDAVRDAMFAESRDVWKNMEQRFKEMSRCLEDHVMMSGDVTEEKEGEGEKTSEEQTDDAAKDANVAKIDNKSKLSRQDYIDRWTSGWMFPRHWMMETISSLKDLDLFKTEHDGEIIRIKDQEDKLEVSLDTSLYKPEELQVRLKDGAVCVEGRHEEKDAQGEQGKEVRSFCRRYSLPHGVTARDITADLAADGVLVISVVKNNAKVEAVRKEVEKGKCNIY